MADTIEAIVTHLHDRLTGDAALDALFPGGQCVLFLEYAHQDRAMPYLVHSFSVGERTPWGVREAAYTLSVWDEAAQAQRALRIRDRVLELLSKYAFETAGGEAVAVRLTAPIDQAVPDTEPDIWRRDLVFGCRFVDAAEIAAIASR